MADKFRPNEKVWAFTRPGETIHGFPLGEHKAVIIARCPTPPFATYPEWYLVDVDGIPPPLVSSAWGFCSTNLRPRDDGDKQEMRSTWSHLETLTGWKPGAPARDTPVRVLEETET